MDDTSSFGHWLKRQRKALDLTQSALANAVPCAIQTIRAIESDTLRPSRELAARLAHALDLPEKDRPAFIAFARRRPSEPERFAQHEPNLPDTATLPVATTSFIGRASEIAALDKQLRSRNVRLLTLFGPGGTGKTRLALQVAARLRDMFADGIWFVDLAPISDPERIVPRIATTLRVVESPTQPLIDSLIEMLRDKQTLLILDNFEQITSAAPVVAALLEACPGLVALVTSRILLGVANEQLFQVPPLSLPATRKLPSLASLERYEAVQLFVERARTAQPEFAISETNRSAVLAICRQLDGLPLGLELAAARLRLLSPSALLNRLDRRLALLTNGSSELPTRQRTMRHTIDWSYGLLAPAEQRVFRRLAVFVGGWTADAAEAICTSSQLESQNILDSMAELLDNSLIRDERAAHDLPDAEPRFTMLETIREYARELLSDSGEERHLRQQHAIYFLNYAEQAAPKLQGAEHTRWLYTLEGEYGNLRSALDWLLAAGDVADATRLATALWYFWVSNYWLAEGRIWLEAVVAQDDAPERLRGHALGRLGDLAHRQGDFVRAQEVCEASLSCFPNDDIAGRAFALLVLSHIILPTGDSARARELCEASLAGFRAANDRFWTAWALYDLVGILFQQHDLERAEALLAESAMLFRQLGFARALPAVLSTRGQVAAAQGHLAHAQRLLEECCGVWTELGYNDPWHIFLLAQIVEARGDNERAQTLFEQSNALYADAGVKLGVAHTLNGLGWLLLRDADLLQASRLFEQSTAIYEQIGDPLGQAQSLCGMGCIALADGADERAIMLFQQSLALYMGRSGSFALPECLEGVAELCLRRGEPLMAARTLGSVNTTSADLGMPRPPTAHAARERLIDVVRGQLSASSFDGAWASGAALTRDEAIAAASHLLDRTHEVASSHR